MSSLCLKNFIFHIQCLIEGVAYYNAEKYGCLYFYKIYIIKDLCMREYVLQIRKLTPN